MSAPRIRTMRPRRPPVPYEDKVAGLAMMLEGLRGSVRTAFLTCSAIMWKPMGSGAVQEGHVIKHYENGNIEVLPRDRGQYISITLDDVVRASQ